MFTVRQIERMWSAGAYDRISSSCLYMRQESSDGLRARLSACATCAAALAIIRLDELNQSHVPLCATLIRHILDAQQADGGWGDVLTAALCLRALTCCHGSGLAIDRGMQFLAGLQRAEGIWPAVCVRRMPGDPFISAFILFHLGQDARFRSAARVEDALRWFEANEDSLDADTARLWRSIRSIRLVTLQRLAPLLS